MENLRKLGLAISLAVIITGNAFAGEVSTPPCANPGEVSTPPRCSAHFIVEEASAASSTVSSEVEMVVFEAASYAVQTLLTLF